MEQNCPIPPRSPLNRHSHHSPPPSVPTHSKNLTPEQQITVTSWNLPPESSNEGLRGGAAQDRGMQRGGQESWGWGCPASQPQAVAPWVWGPRQSPEMPATSMCCGTCSKALGRTQRPCGTRAGGPGTGSHGRSLDWAAVSGQLLLQQLQTLPLQGHQLGPGGQCMPTAASPSR